MNLVIERGLALMKHPGLPARFRDLAAFRQALAEFEIDRDHVEFGEDAYARFTPDKQVAICHDRSFLEYPEYGGVDRFIGIDVATGVTLFEHRERWWAKMSKGRDKESETSDWSVQSETDRVDTWGLTDEAILLSFRSAGSYGPPRHHVNPVAIPISRVPALPAIPPIVALAAKPAHKRRGFPSSLPDLAAFRKALAEYVVDRPLIAIGKAAQARITPDGRVAVYSERKSYGEGQAERHGEDLFIAFDVETAEVLLEHHERWHLRGYSMRDSESETSEWVTIPVDRVGGWTLTDEAILLTFVDEETRGAPRSHENPVAIAIPRPR